jgi:hypothetical protein
MIANLIVKYADMISDRGKNTKDDEKKFVAFKLFDYRNKFYEFLKNIITDKGTKK